MKTDTYKASQLGFVSPDKVKHSIIRSDNTMKPATIINRTQGTEIETETNPETDKVVSIVVTVNTKDLTKAVKDWERKLKDSTVEFARCLHLGMVLATAKSSVNNNNKVYGTWLEKTFPTMSVRYGSYAINLHKFKDDIEEWFKGQKDEVSNRRYGSPEAIYQAFNRDKKKQADAIISDELDKLASETDTGGTPGVAVESENTSGQTMAATTEKSGLNVERMMRTPEELHQHTGASLNQIITILNESKVKPEVIQAMLSETDKHIDAYQKAKVRYYEELAE